MFIPEACPNCGSGNKPRGYRRTIMNINQRGKWHGRKYYFGLHYDLHAGKQDTELGIHCSLRELVPMLKMMAPDFVQTQTARGMPVTRAGSAG